MTDTRESRELWAEINSLKRRIDERERREYGMTSAWTDYSATSTITGWSAFTTQHIYYLRIGKLVGVVFNLVGTSDSTEAKFTLPYTSAANPNYRFVIRAIDNGGTAVAATGWLTAISNLVTTYADMANTVFTNSGTKYIQGQFFYSTG